MNPSGYSGTPLEKKLGIKNEFTIRLINAPEYYFNLFVDFPEDVQITNIKGKEKDFIHYFERKATTLKKNLPLLRKEIAQHGMIWVSWPKKASKVETDITEDTIRNFALTIGLIDIKVCAVDEIWSGLKLVIPLKERKVK
jgi:hypothetical protein